MADDQFGGGELGAQKVGGGDQVVDVGGEIAVGELALAAAEAGEVEAQHGDPGLRQCLRDERSGAGVLGAGKAMREQGIGHRISFRQVEAGRQTIAGAGVEVDRVARHEEALHSGVLRVWP